MHKIPLLIISLLTLIIWGRILNQTFLGEGYYYFDRRQDLFHAENTIWVDDNFAKVIFKVFIPIFKDNIELFLGLQIFIQITVYFCLYYLVYFLSKSRFLAIFTSIIFLSSFVGSYDMIATGNYQRFVQRIPNIIPTIFSLIYLEKYLATNKVKYYLYSISLFILFFLMSHYSVFLISIFIFYPIVREIINFKSFKNIFKSTIISFIYLWVGFFLISKDALKPETGVFNFMLSEPSLIQKIFSQFAQSSLPYFVIEKFKGNIVQFGVGFAVLYVIFGLLLVFKKSKFATLYNASLLSLLIIFVLNLYAGRLNPLVHFGNDRYYFIPLIFISFLWGGILSLFSNNRVSVKIIISGFLFTYIVYNTNLIWKNIAEIQYKSDSMKQYVSYIKHLSPNFNESTILASPTALLWPMPLFKSQYGNYKMKFIDSDDKDWEATILQEDRNNTFVITYNLKTMQVVDMTSAFRNKNYEFKQ